VNGVKWVKVKLNQLKKKEKKVGEARGNPQSAK